MTVPEPAYQLATIVVILALIYMFALLARRVWLSVRGGLFDCALLPAGAIKWRTGLARYQGEYLEWYLVWHPWPRPTRLFARDKCELVGLRDTDPSESRLGYATAKIVDLKVANTTPDRFKLALNAGSAMGLVSWLESAPPGQVGYRRSVL